jgi:acyl-CoA dehydrogenase
MFSIRIGSSPTVSAAEVLDRGMQAASHGGAIEGEADALDAAVGAQAQDDDRAHAAGLFRHVGQRIVLGHAERGRLVACDFHGGPLRDRDPKPRSRPECPFTLPRFSARVRRSTQGETDGLRILRPDQGAQEKLLKFMDEVVYPAEPVYEEQMEKAKDRWQLPPIIEQCKAEAKKRGLWNMFLPADRETGDTHGTMGLSNLEYAPICEVLGRSSIASEAVNCSAPDTGNMEVFARYGSKEHKEKWLKPLLNGEIRSCFAMTEPGVASSDARNVECRIESDGNDYVINGRKWWSSGMGDPRCKVIILMGKSDPNAPAYRQQSMIVVPRDSPGIKIVKMLHVFGYDDAPHGHAEVVYDNVRVPKSDILLGEGRGFEIAQGRLGPGRIHHCMRAIGVAERALEMAIKRAKSRVAFGQRISEMGVTKAMSPTCAWRSTWPACWC